MSQSKDNNYNKQNNSSLDNNSNKNFINSKKNKKYKKNKTSISNDKKNTFKIEKDDLSEDNNLNQKNENELLQTNNSTKDDEFSKLVQDILEKDDINDIQNTTQNLPNLNEDIKNFNTIGDIIKEKNLNFDDLDNSNIQSNTLKNKIFNFNLYILNYFKSIFKKDDAKENENLNDFSKEYSKFREYLILLDDTDDEDNVLKAIDICDDNLKLARHRIYLDKKKKEFELTLKNLQCYKNLSEKDTDYFKNLINEFVSVNNEKRSIRYQLGDFNNSINKLEALEVDAYDSICQIEEAEAEKRILKRDIELIKDEKEKTILDREKLNFAYSIIYKFSFVFSIILGISIVILTLLYMNLKINAFLPLSILCFTLILTVALIYAFRKKIIFELKLNEKKQAKLINILNKKTVVYSYYINFLNYEYRKYNVKSARDLKENLENFESYKFISKRYDSIRKIAHESASKLNDFIKANKIDIEGASLEAFAKSINLDNKVNYYKEVENKKKKLEQRICEIDKQQEALFDELIKLNINDTSKEKVIEKIIQAYITETEKIAFEKHS